MEITKQIDNLIGSESLEKKGEETKNAVYKVFTLAELKEIEKGVKSLTANIEAKIQKLLKSRETSNEA